MEGYVVRYHPEGWRDAKLEPPEASGDYYVAFINEYGVNRCDIAHYDKKDIGWVLRSGVKVTHWQPLPTPPWEIMPKENKK